MNRTNDVNTIGSALDFQTDKSIELEYKNMPELPIQQHEAAFHIQNFIEKRLAKWERFENKDKSIQSTNLREE